MSLESVLLDYIGQTYLPQTFCRPWSDKDLQFFLKGARWLSNAFTKERGDLPKNYFNQKELRSGYLLYFLLTNFAKVIHCLKQMERQLPDKKILQILDFGCGPGTAALACSTFFRERELKILGLDQNRSILQDARNLWNRSAPSHHHLEARPMILHRKNVAPILGSKTFDLIFAVNFFNELGDLAEQEEIALALLNHLGPDGFFILIDVATQKVTRQIMTLRDRLLQRGHCFVVAPCLHEKGCPMLTANTRDWCHFYIDWERPKIIRDVDLILGIKHEYLKMVYLILQNAFSVQYPVRSTHHWRVVSSPLLSKGKRELILCGKPGILKKVTRLDKEASESNKNFDIIRRGDIVGWEGGTHVGKADLIPLIKKIEKV